MKLRRAGIGAAVGVFMMCSGAPCLGQSQANDDLARQGRFHQPPPPLPVQTPLVAAPARSPNSNQAANIGGPRRRPWRDLTDSLLDMMAPRTMTFAGFTDDPQTTGFGNSDFVEPTFDLSKGLPTQSTAAAQQNQKE